MNENEKNQNTQQEKSTLDEKRKNALLRYVAIMFAVAFVFVLLSMFTQMRNNRSTISELNQSSTSALQKAEALQEHNQDLEKENSYLKGRMEEMEERLDELEDALKEAEKNLINSEKENETLQKELDELKKTAEEEKNAITTAYEQLLALQNAVTPGSQNGTKTAEKIVSELEDYVHLLKDNAQKLYENLLQEGE